MQTLLYILCAILAIVFTGLTGNSLIHKRILAHKNEEDNNSNFWMWLILDIWFLIPALYRAFMFQR